MASRSVKLPDIGEGVAEAEIVVWHVKVGDVVREDQPLADVMTDKATVEIPSPANGTVAALGVEAGQMLAVGGELVRLDVADAAGAAPAPMPDPVHAAESVAAAPTPRATLAPIAPPAASSGTFRSVKLPDIGEGVAEAEVVVWHVKVGDIVREDQPLADVMTDKATVEIPSPANGTIVALGVAAGGMLAVGGELARLQVAGVATADLPERGIEMAADTRQAQDAEAGVPAARLEPAGDGLQPTPAASPAPAQAPSPRSAAAPAPRPAAPAVPRAAPAGPRRAPGEKPVASPAVRRRALEAGIDLRRVAGSGPAGRIGHDDLDAYLAVGDEPQAAPVAAGRQPNVAVEDIKVIGLRRRIAQKMADSKRKIAHFSYVEEIDVTALEELRAALNARHGAMRPKLTLIPFLVRALVRVMPDFPQMNALYDDDAEVIHRHGGVHVGIATQTPNGLMVPVLRHAEARDLWDAAAEVRRLADAARTGLAARDELTGSTITITSLGALGGIVSTPVINRPEVAIVGVNKQVMRPLWRDGAFVPRLTMNLSSSFDHRVVDGYDAALFVQAIKALLETPAMLFMDT